MIGLGLGRRIIASKSAPAGTIGYTVSSCSTWKSITIVLRFLRAASTAGMTSPRRRGEITKDKQ